MVVGGAGHPGGSGYYYGTTGSGGLIILIVWGTLKININGLIVSNGSDGGTPRPTSSGYGGGSGGRFN